MNTTHALLHKLARQIATHLGWTYHEQNGNEGRYAQLDHPQMQGAALMIHRRDQRLEISGIYARNPDDRTGYYGPYENPPQITVSAAREPQAIARDIQRRFIPDYLREFEHSRERVDETRLDYSRRRDALEQIAAALGHTLEPDTLDIHTTRFKTYIGKTHVTVKVYSDVTIEILWANLETAVAVARALNEAFIAHLTRTESVKFTGSPSQPTYKGITEAWPEVGHEV